MKHSRRASRILTFVGATVVLATFVANDVMRNSLRNETNSLNSIQDFYISQSYLVDIEDTLSYVKQEVDLSKETLSSHQGDSSDYVEKTVSIRAEAGYDRLFADRHYIYDAAALMDKLSVEKPEVIAMRRLYSDCTKSLSKVLAFEKGLPELIKAINSSKTNPQVRKEKLLLYISGIREIEDSTASIESRAKKLANGTVSELDTTLRHKESQYMVVSLFSYALFGAGWVLGLIGQVIGDDGTKWQGKEEWS